MTRLKIFAKRNRVSCMAALLCMSAFPAAWSQSVQQPWTTVGAAGTPDTASLLLVGYGNPIPESSDAPPMDYGAVTFQPIAFGTVNLRYNVVSVPGILNTTVSMTARYLSQGTNGRVVVTLNQYNLAQGTTTTLLTLDSNSQPFSGAFQVRSTGECGGATLDFTQNSYYVEVSMTRTATSPFQIITSPFAARPALGMVQLSPAICIQ